MTTPRPHSWLVVTLALQVRQPEARAHTPGYDPLPPALQGKALDGAAPYLGSPTPLSRPCGSSHVELPSYHPELPLPWQSPTSPSKLSLLGSFLEC